jgi:hypothetical protein
VALADTGEASEVPGRPAAAEDESVSAVAITAAADSAVRLTDGPTEDDCNEEEETEADDVDILFAEREEGDEEGALEAAATADENESVEALTATVCLLEPLIWLIFLGLLTTLETLPS